MGMTSISLLLAPNLEVDKGNVIICLGNFYQGLLGYDVLLGHNEALGPAIIALPGLE